MSRSMMEHVRRALAGLRLPEPAAEQDKSQPAQTLKSIPSADGKRRVDIVALGRGMFRFVEETEQHEDDEGWGAYDYWTPTHQSGLYASAEDAERDARLTLSWLEYQSGS